MTSSLNSTDVQSLASDPSADARAEMAGKVATEFGDQKLTAAERRIAEDIFRGLMLDAEVRVRQALSEHLKDAPGIPHDVAVTLAKDVDAVSLPILEFCEILSDDDLIEIVRGHGGSQQEAVARRSRVSAQLADALIDTQNEAAVAQLVANEGADLNVQALERVAGEYDSSEAVTESLAERPNLPAAVSEQLIHVVTNRLQSYLARNLKLPAETVRNLVRGAGERATAGLLSDGCADEKELEDLVEQMHMTGRLTGSAVMEILSTGDLRFFEMAMSRLANIPVESARDLIHDQGPLGLQAVLNAADC